MKDKVWDVVFAVMIAIFAIIGIGVGAVDLLNQLEADQKVEEE